MKSLRISAILMVLLGLSACGKNNGNVTGADAGLSGASALNSIAFSADPRTSTFEWESNSLFEMNFTIGGCDEDTCSALFWVSCVGDDGCTTEDWRPDKAREPLQLRAREKTWNGHRHYRLDVCGGEGWRNLQIQAELEGATGNWIPAQEAPLRENQSCRQDHRH